MRVALICLARRGGMTHFHAELANAMHKIHSETLVITSYSAPSSYYSPEISRLSVNMGKDSAGTLLNAINPLSWLRLYRLLQGSNADIFHIVASHEWNPLLAQIVSMLGKPMVFTMHDPEHHLGAPFYMRIFDGLLIDKSKAIIVLSKLGKKQIQSKGVSQDKIFYIPHGVYSFFHRWDIKVDKQEKMLLFFGRIEPYKGLKFLLKAFAQVANDLPDWKLVIAGNGDITPYLTDLHHPQIEVINRFIPDEEVVDLMKCSRIVVLPYIEATQSGVIPIAYAFARPVIATDVGSLGEMVVHGRTGLLVPPKNIEQLAQAIKVMATNGYLCDQMGREGYEMSQKEWGWEMIAQKHLDVYTNIFESNNNK